MSGAGEALPEPLQQHFLAPAHAGIPAAALGAGPGDGGELASGEAGTQAQGTWVRLMLRLRSGRIVTAGFNAYGCPYTLAVCDWLAGELAGRALGDPGVAGPRDWARALAVPEERLTRLLVIEDALQAALRNAQAGRYNGP